MEQVVKFDDFKAKEVLLAAIKITPGFTRRLTDLKEAAQIFKSLQFPF